MQEEIQFRLTHGLPIPLPEVVTDTRARDGTWCKAPYPNHKNGCPNYPQCIQKRRDISTLLPHWKHWYAVTEQFDLKEHANRMYRNSVERAKNDPKGKKKPWTRRQCRNVIYWQPTVRMNLREKTELNTDISIGDIILDIPEANGVNIFATMAKIGVNLKADPDMVTKVMLIGKRTDLQLVCDCGWKSKLYPPHYIFSGPGGQLMCPECTDAKRNQNIEVYGNVRMERVL